MLIEKDMDRGFRFILALILSLIVTVTVAFNSGFLNFLDSTITDLIQGHQSGLKTTFYTIVSMIASPKMDILWSVVIAFILWGFKYKIPALWTLFTLAGADVIGFVMKNLMQRPRPLLHLAADTGYSYPSGHVTGSFIILAIIWIVILPMMKSHRKQTVVRVILVLLAIVIAFSRIYLNAHFPSDTVGAVLIAYSWLQISEWLYLMWAPKIAQLSFVKNTKY